MTTSNDMQLNAHDSHHPLHLSESTSTTAVTASLFGY